MKCIKYTLFIFNFIIWICGIVILACGLYLLINDLVDSSPYYTLAMEDGSEKFFTYALIIVGSLIMLLGFLGCCGAILENKCMLIVFFVLLILIFLILVAAGLIAVFMKEDLGKKAVEAMKMNLEEHLKVINDEENKADPSEYSANFNGTANYFKQWNCCGMNGTTDIDPQKLKPACGEYTKGCLNEQKDSLERLWLIYVAVIFSSAFVALLGIILAIMLCCALRDYYDYE